MKREKPPIECRTRAQLKSRDDDGSCFILWGATAIVGPKSVTLLDENDFRIELKRSDFDIIARWYTGTEPKQPRATRRKGK